MTLTIIAFVMAISAWLGVIGLLAYTYSIHENIQEHMEINIECHTHHKRRTDLLAKRIDVNADVLEELIKLRQNQAT